MFSTIPFFITSASSGGGPGPSPYDPDAQAFFDRVTAAGGTLTTTEKDATNQLVLDLKADSIWGNLKAVYPMVGSSAAACAQNLISSSFTGTFSSGWTFSSTGVLPNGSAYMDTGLSPVSELGLNSTHIGFYSRTNYQEPSTALDIGSTSLLYIVGWGLNDVYHANNSSESLWGGGDSPTNSLGLIINNRNSSSEMSAWRAGVETTDSTTSAAFSTTQPSPNLYLGAYNNGSSAALFTNREYAFCTIGLGLSDTQATDYTTIVQTFQTTLSRQV